MLGPSSAGGCGATVTVPSPDPDSGPNETLDETIVDSDGDGFSDDEEHNGTPGTDPDDPTDNPNNVRNSDGDECSDYDEINFGFCDNDPFTSSCQTTFYNADYNYGFDLPPEAELTVDEGAGLFFRLWLFTFEDSRIGISTGVYDAPAQSLEEYVAGVNQINEAGGDTIVDTIAFTLADGKPAYLIQSVSSLGIVNYQVVTIADGFVYSLTTNVPNDAHTNVADAFMLGILETFCVD
jgi:hypothetical protein